MVIDTLGIGVLAKVRYCANTAFVLGTASFRDQVRLLRNQIPASFLTLSPFNPGVVCMPDLITYFVGREFRKSHD